MCQVTLSNSREERDKDKLIDGESKLLNDMGQGSQLCLLFYKHFITVM